MWSDEKQQQFDRLRQREAQGVLSEAEAETLRALISELDAEEAAALRPAIEQMRAKQEELAIERHRVEQENERLAAILAKRKERTMAQKEAQYQYETTESRLTDNTLKLQFKDAGAFGIFCETLAKERVLFDIGPFKTVFISHDQLQQLAGQSLLLFEQLKADERVEVFSPTLAPQGRSIPTKAEVKRLLREFQKRMRHAEEAGKTGLRLLAV